MTPRKKNAIFFRSSQQLSCLSLRPTKGFLSWHSALQGPSTRFVRCVCNSRETRTLSGVARESQDITKQLSQTLIKRLFKMHFFEKSTEYNWVSDQTWSTAVFAWRASSSPSSCQTSAQSFGIQGHSADSVWYSRCRAWSKLSTSKTITASLGNMQPSTAPSACWGCQISLHSFYSSRNIFSPRFLPARNAIADFCIFFTADYAYYGLVK